MTAARLVGLLGAPGRCAVRRSRLPGAATARQAKPVLKHACAVDRREFQIRRLQRDCGRALPRHGGGHADEQSWMGFHRPQPPIRQRRRRCRGRSGPLVECSARPTRRSKGVRRSARRPRPGSPSACAALPVAGASSRSRDRTGRASGCRPEAGRNGSFPAAGRGHCPR